MLVPRQKMKETQQQKDAFEDYWNLGTDRSLTKLQEHYTGLALKTGKMAPSIRSLKRWSTLYNWQEKVMLRAKNINLGVEERITNEEINMRVESLKNARQAVDTLRSLLQSAFYKDEDGKHKLKPDIEITSTKDLEKVASAIIKGELGIQNLIEPEEHMTGTLKITFEDVDNANGP